MVPRQSITLEFMHSSIADYKCFCAFSLPTDLTTNSCLVILVSSLIHMLNCSVIFENSFNVCRFFSC